MGLYWERSVKLWGAALHVPYGYLLVGQLAFRNLMGLHFQNKTNIYTHKLVVLNGGGSVLQRSAAVVRSPSPFAARPNNLQGYMY